MFTLKTPLGSQAAPSLLYEFGFWASEHLKKTKKHPKKPEIHDSHR